MLKKMDMFAAPLPQFNIHGEEAVKTNPGGCVSIVILYTTLVFAMLKLQYLISRQNPMISSYTSYGEFDESQKYYTGHEDFVVAVALIIADTGEAMNDPRYIKWVAKYRENRDGVNKVEKIIPMHPCSQKEFEKFYQVEPSSTNLVEKLRASDGLYCINYEAHDFVLYGDKFHGNFAQLDLQAVPCHQRESAMEGEATDYVRDDCVTTQESTFEYFFDTTDLVILHNQVSFQSNEYGEKRFNKRSTTQRVRVDVRQPNWNPTLIQKNLLQDETDYF